MCLARMPTIDDGGEGGVWSRAGREGGGARSEPLRHRGRRKRCSDGSRRQIGKGLCLVGYVLWMYQGIYSGCTRVYTVDVPGYIPGFWAIYSGCTRDLPCYYQPGDVPGYDGVFSRVYTLNVPGYVPGYDQHNQGWYPGTYPSIYPIGHILAGLLGFGAEAELGWACRAF